MMTEPPREIPKGCQAMAILPCDAQKPRRGGKQSFKEPMIQPK